MSGCPGGGCNGRYDREVLVVICRGSTADQDGRVCERASYP